MAQIVLLVCAALLAVVTALPTKTHVHPVLKTLSGLPIDGCAAGMVRCQSGGIHEVGSDQLVCIPEDWVCDNWNDCGDASDEDLSMCGYNRCSEGYGWQCPNTNLCIPSYWICNNWDDCGDNADENCDDALGIFDIQHDVDDSSIASDMSDSSYEWDDEYADYYSACYHVKDKATKRNITRKHHSSSKTYPCGNNEFECNDGECIPIYWYCDQYVDCEDASDEFINASCMPLDCSEFCSYRCPNTNICNYEYWICDGYDDCGDGSDEYFCEYQPIKSRNPGSDRRHVKSKVSQAVHGSTKKRMYRNLLQQIKGTQGGRDHKPHIG